jgi:FRG domain
MKFKDETLEKSEDLFKLYNSEFTTTETQWIFRGLPDAGYKLKTTLERVAKRFGQNLHNDLERNMIRHFKRQAHLYLQNPPQDDATIEWLALMQHFESPTRFQDWTYSFFVALFFAVEQSKKPCAVWAIDMDWLKKKADIMMFDPAVEEIRKTDPRLKSGAFFDCVFRKDPATPLVYPLNPERTNERLTVQQGLFLVPADISKPFEENLDAIQDTDPTDKIYGWKITIGDAVKLRREILFHLHRMNINRASLFPGLGGFAQSLATRLANADIWLR